MHHVLMNIIITIVPQQEYIYTLYTLGLSFRWNGLARQYIVVFIDHMHDQASCAYECHYSHYCCCCAIANTSTFINVP